MKLEFSKAAVMICWLNDPLMTPECSEQSLPPLAASQGWPIEGAGALQAPKSAIKVTFISGFYLQSRTLGEHDSV